MKKDTNLFRMGFFPQNAKELLPSSFCMLFVGSAQTKVMVYIDFQEFGVLVGGTTLPYMTFAISSYESRNYLLV